MVSTVNNGSQWYQSYYILQQLPPPGEFRPLRLQPSVGYRWIRLDLQGPKTSVATRISGPDHRGRRRQVPGGPEPGQHQGLIFEQSCWNKSCLGCLGVLFSTFSGQPGPSGSRPESKTARIRLWVRSASEIYFWVSCWNKSSWKWLNGLILYDSCMSWRTRASIYNLGSF